MIQLIGLVLLGLVVFFLLKAILSFAVKIIMVLAVVLCAHVVSVIVFNMSLSEIIMELVNYVLTFIR